MTPAVVFMTGVGLTLGLIIALANRFFAVQVDPRIEKVEEMLPGANCGGCGFSGCAAFARSIVEHGSEPAKCPVCSSEQAGAIARFMGTELEFSEPYVALIKCCGDNVHSPERALYNGVNDCNSAVLVAGATKACQSGCLGLASCARVCPFNAIEIDGELKIAKVHPDICVGCGKCTKSCPRHLIDLVPKSAPVHVFCHSPEKASIQKKYCAKGCIGCRRCVKLAPESIVMAGFLATVDYENCPKDLRLVDVCPVHCIRPSVGLDYIAPLKPPGGDKVSGARGKKKSGETEGDFSTPAQS